MVVSYDKASYTILTVIELLPMANASKITAMTLSKSTVLQIMSTGERLLDHPLTQTVKTLDKFPMSKEPDIEGTEGSYRF